MRLYEVVDTRSETPPEVKEGVDIFHAGRELFENKEWDKARKRFAETLKVLPDDGPATTFLKRCDANIQTPPPDTWDGVFNLMVK